MILLTIPFLPYMANYHLIFSVQKMKCLKSDFHFMYALFISQIEGGKSDDVKEQKRQHP